MWKIYYPFFVLTVNCESNDDLKMDFNDEKCYLYNLYIMVNIFIKEYRRQRNYVTKLKSKSINTYFIERRTGGPKSKDFWPTVKPFLTNKDIVNQKDTVLSENDVLITKQDEVCEIFNNFLIMWLKILETIK